MKTTEQNTPVYVCVDGESILCYSKSLGTRRTYRQPISDISPGMKPFTYKTQRGAQRRCDWSNKVTGNNHQPLIQTQLKINP